MLPMYVLWTDTEVLGGTVFTFNTFTPWQWDVRYNTCTHTYLHQLKLKTQYGQYYNYYSNTQYICILYILICTLVGIKLYNMYLSNDTPHTVHIYILLQWLGNDNDQVTLKRLADNTVQAILQYICMHTVHVYTSLDKLCISLNLLHTLYISIHTSSITSTWHIDVLALLWLAAHLNGQVGRVSLHVLSLLLLLSCWCPLPFWTCFDTVPSPCMEGGSSPASQEGLRQLGVLHNSPPLSSALHLCNLLYITATTTALSVQVDSDSVNTSDMRTDNTVTVTASCGHGLATVWRRPQPTLVCAWPELAFTSIINVHIYVRIETQVRTEEESATVAHGSSVFIGYLPLVDDVFDAS